MALAHEKIQPLNVSLEMNPLVLSAFVQVLNKRTEEQEKSYKEQENKDKKNNKVNNTSNLSEQQKVVQEAVPKLDEKQKAKLEGKLTEFKDWMKEVDFDNIYNVTKDKAYREEKWD